MFFFRQSETLKPAVPILSRRSLSAHAPDDLAAFAKGQLGILQAGFDSNEYAVAFRYLNGGKLSAAERQAIRASSRSPATDSDCETGCQPDRRRAGSR